MTYDFLVGLKKSEITDFYLLENSKTKSIFCIQPIIPIFHYSSVCSSHEMVMKKDHLTMKLETSAIPVDLVNPEPCSFETADAQVALEWCAVLASQKIDFELNREGEVWLFKISPPNFTDAKRNIDDYENERDFFLRHQEEFDRPPAPLRLAKAMPFILCGILLGLFFMVTGTSDEKSIFFTQGMLSPHAFYREGELWRTVTSLTLHADFPHLLGNILFFAIFATITARRAGGGIALFFIFISGVFGNLSTITLFGENSYNSLGASTAVFGALGIIVSLSLLRPKPKHLFFNNLLPLVSGIALLAFTGTAPGADVSAHLFGFLWGAGLGVLLNNLNKMRDNMIVQIIFFGITFLTIFYCWSLALR